MVIGAAVRRACGAEAERAIAGFTTLNDVTCRDWQSRTGEWLQGKTWPSTTPLGPYVVTPDELPGGVRPALTLRTLVDGETVKEGDTGDLLFDPVALVEYASTILTLRPGDVLAAARRAPGAAEAVTGRLDVAAAFARRDYMTSDWHDDGQARWLIQRAMANRLPREILENKKRGLQAADWYARLYTHRADVLDELAAAERCELAARSIDLKRLRELVEQIPEHPTDIGRAMFDYRSVLELGLMTAAFVRWVETS